MVRCSAGCAARSPPSKTIGLDAPFALTSTRMATYVGSIVLGSIVKTSGFWFVITVTGPETRAPSGGPSQRRQALLAHS